MKKISILIGLLLLPSLVVLQEIQEEASVVNIEVPLRVYDSGVFVNDLTIGDLELFEDGVPQKIVEQIKTILHRDAWMGNADYRSIVKELIHAVKLFSTAEGAQVSLEASDDADGNLLSWDKYELLRDQLESLRTINENQREFIPEFKREVYDRMMDNNVVEQQFKLMDYLEQSPRETAFDVKRIKQAYADSSVTINFLFFSKPTANSKTSK